MKPLKKKRQICQWCGDFILPLKDAGFKLGGKNWIDRGCFLAYIKKGIKIFKSKYVT
jgi:hypothetical protein